MSENRRHYGLSQAEFVRLLGYGTVFTLTGCGIFEEIQADQRRIATGRVRLTEIPRAQEEARESLRDTQGSPEWSTYLQERLSEMHPETLARAVVLSAGSSFGSGVFYGLQSVEGTTNGTAAVILTARHVANTIEGGMIVYQPHRFIEGDRSREIYMEVVQGSIGIAVHSDPEVDFGVIGVGVKPEGFPSEVVQPPNITTDIRSAEGQILGLGFNLGEGMEQSITPMSFNTSDATVKDNSLSVRVEGAVTGASGTGFYDNGNLVGILRGLDTEDSEKNIIVGIPQNYPDLINAALEDLRISLLESLQPTP